MSEEAVYTVVAKDCHPHPVERQKFNLSHDKTVEGTRVVLTERREIIMDRLPSEADAVERFCVCCSNCKNKKTKHDFSLIVCHCLSLSFSPSPDILPVNDH